jgi:hypothetical protein
MAFLLSSNIAASPNHFADATSPLPPSCPRWYGGPGLETSAKRWISEGRFRFEPYGKFHASLCEVVSSRMSLRQLTFIVRSQVPTGERSWESRSEPQFAVRRTHATSSDYSKLSVGGE